MSLLSCLLSTACGVGLALAIALTIHGRGRHLVAGCNSSALPADARAAIVTNDCPFNTTRIYVSPGGCHMPPPRPISFFCLRFLSASFFLSLCLCPRLALPLPFCPLPRLHSAASGAVGAGPVLLSELRPSALQDTALALWIPSVVLVAAEAVLSGSCCLAALILRGVGPCARRYGKEQVRPLGPRGLPLLCPPQLPP